MKHIKAFILDLILRCFIKMFFDLKKQQPKTRFCDEKLN